MTHAANAKAEKAREPFNTARYFIEHPHISWVLLLGTVAWGVYGYTHRILVVPDHEFPR